jgi:polysaccharide export outer membrane protein
MYTTSSFKLVQLAVAAALLFMLASCGVAKRNYREMIYFQNAKQVNTPVRLQLKPTVIQKYDQLMIQVYAQSINQEQALLFNMTSGIGQNQNGVVNVQQGNTLAGYIVDYEGNIDFPIIGKVKAMGYTKSEFIDTLKNHLKAYIKDPIVVVRYLNYNITVLGEVNSPGLKSFPNEKATVLDAISAAGDIRDAGLRKSILLIRTMPDGTIQQHEIDLTNIECYNSPYFQLQPNDVLYVPSNKIRLRNANQDPTIYRDLPLALSFLSYLLLLNNVFRFIN